MKSIISLIFCLSIFYSGFSQEKWEKYKAIPGVDSLSCIAFQKDKIWIGTKYMGLICCDTNFKNIVRYTTKDGLKTNSVTAIAIDSIGAVYVGLKEGYSIFKDNVWVNYKFLNSICSVIGITVDIDNKKWIVSNCNGILYGDYKDWKVVNNPTKNLLLNDMAIDKKGTKWFASQNLGVIKYEDTVWTYYNNTNSALKYNYISFICLDTNGTPWVNSSTGVYKLEGSTWIPKESGISSTLIVDMQFDDANKLWVPTFDGKLNVFENGKWSLFNDSLISKNGGYINSINIKDNKTFWLCYSDGGGLVKINEKYKTRIRISYKLGVLNNHINSIAQDSLGNFWFGTSNGISKFDGKNWDGYDLTMAELPDRYISTIIIDKNNNIICTGLNGDISKFDGINWIKIYQFASDYKFKNAVSAELDKNGTIWYGSHDRGLASFKNNKLENYTYSNSGIVSNRISSISIDGEGVKWISSGYPSGNVDWWWDYHFFDTTDIGGVSAFDNSGNWASFNTKNSFLPVNNITCIKIDDQNRKWISTWGGGIVVLDGIRMSKFNTSNSNILNDYTYSMAIDNNNTKWFVNRGGLLKFDNYSLNFSTTNNGILPDTVTSIFIDKLNRKWFATHSGIFVMEDTIMLKKLNINTIIFSKCSVYPNPFSDETTVEFDNPFHNKVSFIIINHLGQIVKTSEITSGNQIRIKRDCLVGGLYTLIGTSEKNRYISKLMIIN